MQVHVDPPLIPLTKNKNYQKLDNYFVKIKLHVDPTSEKSDLYEFKIYLFDNGDPKEFLLFIRYFNMNIDASGTLMAGANIQYVHMLVGGEALHQCDALFAEVEDATPVTLEYIILSLGTLFSLLMSCLSKSVQFAAESGSHAD